MKNKLQLPKFEDEDKERDFWDQVDLSDYFKKEDFVKGQFPDLKPTSQAISIRLPVYLIYDLKQKANAAGIPYQSLIKWYLKEGLTHSQEQVVLSSKGRKR
jgi:predicted DNA binding CopG/RHH family protein